LAAGLSTQAQDLPFLEIATGAQSNVKE